MGWAGFDPAFTLVLAVALACVVLPQQLAVITRVPSWLEWPLVEALNGAIAWINAVFSPVLRTCSVVLDWMIRLLDRILSGLPWPVFLTAVGLAVLHVAGWRLALLSVFTGFYVLLTGYWTETMRTLTLVMFALPLAALLGLAAGLASFASRKIAGLIDFCLDVMQTVPAFAFLVPMIVLFGFGPVPGVVASILFAAPSMARNVRLGLEMTPKETIDAALISGCTRTQMFLWVRLPGARRQILLGLNQAIMATLSMVIFAAAIGGFEDIGWEVLRAARRAEFGNGILAGGVITLLAVLLDRVTAAFAKRDITVDGKRTGRREVAIVALALVVAWAVSLLPITTGLPNLRGPVAGWLDQAVLALSVTLDPLTGALKDSITTYLLLPLRAGLGRTVTPATWGFAVTPVVTAGYALLVLTLAFAARGPARRSAVLFGGLLLYTGFTTFPWLPMIAAVVLLGYRLGGFRLAAKVGIAASIILVAGFWPSAMFSLYITAASVFACIVMGGVAGILAAEYSAVSRIMRPLNDFLQTIPPFVILIPVIMFFKIGDFSSFIAIVAYSVAAMSRYTEEGLRSVPQTQLEVGTLSGCNRLQLIALVKLPAAREQLVLGVRQTIMFALAMLSVAALVGSRGLGQDVYVALGKADAGLGLMAGLSIALIAMIADGLLSALMSRSGRRTAPEH